jgi:hypothetical protein
MAHPLETGSASGHNTLGMLRLRVQQMTSW